MSKSYDMRNVAEEDENAVKINLSGGLPGTKCKAELN